MKTKVLVPVDITRNSLTAENYALQLSGKLPLSVTLVNVLNTKRLQDRGISPADQSRIKKTMRARAEAMLTKSMEPFEKAAIEVEARIEEGEPGEVICGLAEGEGFEIVIIPQSGLSELEEILGGSVVRTVLNRCRTPVLLVKHAPEQIEQQLKIRANNNPSPS